MASLPSHCVGAWLCETSHADVLTDGNGLTVRPHAERGSKFVR